MRYQLAQMAIAAIMVTKSVTYQGQNSSAVDTE